MYLIKEKMKSFKDIIIAVWESVSWTHAIQETTSLLAAPCRHIMRLSVLATGNLV